MDTFYLLRDTLTNDVGWYIKVGNEYKSVEWRWAETRPAEYFEVLDTQQRKYWEQLPFERTTSYQRIWLDTQDPKLLSGLMAPDGTMYYCKYMKHEEIAWYMGTQQAVLLSEGWLHIACRNEQVYIRAEERDYTLGQREYTLTAAQVEKLKSFLPDWKKELFDTEWVEFLLEEASIIELPTKWLLKPYVGELTSS